MTIATSVRTAGPYTGTGAVSVYPFAFKVFQASDLLVNSTNTLGAISTLVLSSDYSVTLNADQDNNPGGTINLTAALASGYVLNITSNVPATQSASLTNGGGFFPKVIEGALDRLTILLQQTGLVGVVQSLRVPEIGGIPVLPAAAARANRVQTYDSAGNPVMIVGVDSSSAAALALDLAASGNPAKGTGLLGWLRSLTGAVATTVYKLLGWSNVNALEFFTSAQVTDATGYTGSLDVTAPLQSALDQSSAAKRDVSLNAGLYKTTGLVIPGDPAVYQDATSARRISGQGFGNPFGRTFTGGTILRSTTNAPVLQDISAGAGTINGTTEIDHLRIEGNTNSNVVLLRSSLYGVSSFHHNMVYQEGVGSGLSITYSATGSVHDCYVMNRDWLGTPTLGAARVGTGYQFVQNADSGLSSFYKLTSRGFLNGYTFDGAGKVYCGSLRDSEVSVCYNGIVLGNVERFAVSGVYMEGLEGGIGVSDSGQATSVSGTLIFPGFSTGIESASVTYGNTYTGNSINNGSVANSIGMRIVSSGAGGGPGKTVTGNHFGFSGSGGAIVGVVGLQLEGVDPRINWYGNSFEPRGKWVGGAGTKKINNISTSSDGTTGTGIYGLGIAQSLSEAIEVPYLGRGAVNLKVDPTALTNASVSGGVLTIGELSIFTLTTGANVSISAISAPNLPDKTFQIHVTSTAFSVTFSHGANLKLAGSTNLVLAGGSAGAWLTFQVKPGGVVWETARCIY